MNVTALACVAITENATTGHGMLWPATRKPARSRVLRARKNPHTTSVTNATTRTAASSGRINGSAPSTTTGAGCRAPVPRAPPDRRAPTARVCPRRTVRTVPRATRPRSCAPGARSRQPRLRAAHQVREQPPRAGHTGGHLAEQRVAAVHELAAAVLRIEQPAVARRLARIVRAQHRVVVRIIRIGE